MKTRAFKQGTWTGLCGPYAIANALAGLPLGPLNRADVPAFVRRVTGALACGFPAVVREGTDRAQMETMLAEARRWTGDRSWRDWTWTARHPRRGSGNADGFWNELAADLAASPKGAIIGFGDDSLRDPYLEPHWTCVERIEPTRIRLRDSDDYDVIARTRTGVRPEPGWDIEDCFVLQPA